MTRDRFLDLTPWPIASKWWCAHPSYTLMCCVPFCNRTRGHRKNDPIVPGMEWICSEHWRALPRTDRRVYARAKRRVDRFARKVQDRLWRALKAKAIKIAMVGTSTDAGKRDIGSSVFTTPHKNPTNH